MHVLKLIPLGVALGLGLPHVNSAAVSPIVDPVAARPQETPVGDPCMEPESDLAVEAVPIELSPSGLEFAVEFTESPFDTTAGAFGAALWDDVGNLVEAPQLSDVEDVSLGGFGETFRVPAGLSDGYYRVQLMAVAGGPTDQASTEAEVHLAVLRGELLVISAEEWRENSRSRWARGGGTATVSPGGSALADGVTLEGSGF